MARNLGFWLLEGVRGLMRHRLTAAVTILGMTLSIWIFGVIYLIWSNVRDYRNKLISGFQMEVFMEPAVSSNELAEVGDLIADLDGVEQVDFVSPQQAAEIFAKEFGGEIFAILENNPLPASFKVTVKPSKNTARLAEELKGKITSMRGVDEVAYQGGLIELLEKRFDSLIKALLAVTGILFIGTMFVFFQGIKLSLASRSVFVSSLFLCGAKINTIKLPFVLEGIMTGLVAGAVAYFGITTVTFIIDRFFISLEITGFPALAIPAGAALGFLGASFSVSRNLTPFLLEK